ncbi:MAG: GGDEF domain-containing protein, partial [Oscillospiraceae bacterium]|nr:GGDEF domain-containing protein [Oscillospiraceae bacterium]
LVNFAATFFEDFSLGARVTAAACVVIALAAFLFVFRTGKSRGGSLALVLLYNFLLFPVTFFTSGGLLSGMPMYFVLGIVFTSILLEGKLQLIFTLLCLVNDCILLAVAYYVPSLVTPLPAGAAFLTDVIISFIVLCFCTCTAFVLLSRAHEQEHTKVEHFNEYLREQSIHDPLTNLFNRRYLLDTMDEYILAAQRQKVPFCIVMFDIDLFKRVNDTYGHLAGDGVLRNFSQLLLMETRPGDLAGRYGGEEFILLLPRTNFHEAESFANNLREIVESCSLMDTQQEIVTVSGGVGIWRQGMTVQDLIEDADKKLYQAKQTGRNKIVA